MSPTTFNIYMQELVKDLQVAKRQTWDEKENQSARFEEERKANLANKVNISCFRSCVISSLDLVWNSNVHKSLNLVFSIIISVLRYHFYKKYNTVHIWDSGIPYSIRLVCRACLVLAQWQHAKLPTNSS